CMVFLLMGGAYLRSRIKQAGKWDQETIVSFFLCQYCSGEYLPTGLFLMVVGQVISNLAGCWLCIDLGNTDRNYW
ncbi:hypothetical protein VCX22_23460, partial [Aeromonas caviae]|uniref:hypothetical protein n=1 Tax=Aeromonas caviae TaxID=648 RepID=UPI002B24C186